MSSSASPRPPSPAPPSPPSLLRVALAFGTIYVVWGSTYLAIKWAVETLPTFLMAGARFLLAGAFLCVWSRLRGAPRPTAREWAGASVIGALLLLGGNGCVVWAASRLPSAITSLIVATTPFWIVSFEWIRPGGTRPTTRTFLGLAIGFVGLLLLKWTAGAQMALVPALVVLFGTLCWSTGSILSRSIPLPSSGLMAAGIEQVAGGVLLLAVGLSVGEAGAFDPSAVSTRSALAFLYLLTVGSLVAFTAYIWLLQVSSPAKVSTYAYVNPIVAVFLGWGLGGELLVTRDLLAAGVIVSAVAIITLDRARVRLRGRRASQVAPDIAADVAESPLTTPGAPSAPLPIRSSTRPAAGT